MDYIKTIIKKYFFNYIIYIKLDTKRYKKLKKGLNYREKTISLVLLKSYLKYIFTIFKTVLDKQ